MIDVTDQERSENFFQAKYDELRKEMRDEHTEMAYLKKENEELRERVKKLASRQPSGLRDIVLIVRSLIDDNVLLPV